MQKWFPNSNDHAVEYYDAIKVGMWQHISCTVDSSQSILRGTVFNRQDVKVVEENGYVKDAHSYIDKFVLARGASDNVAIYINSDGTGNNGLSNIQYADVRVWNQARDWKSIKLHRNNIINYK